MLLRQIAKRMAKVRAQKSAYIFDGRSWTWSQISELSGRVAGTFREFGVGAGDRVGIVAQDRIEMIAHWHGCMRSGVVRVGLNWRYAPQEMEFIVDDADLKMVVIQDVFVDKLKTSIERWKREGRILVELGNQHGLDFDLDQLLASDRSAPAEPVLSPDSPIAVSYTSGSTGVPKGAVLTQVGAWTQIMSSPYAGGFRTEDVILNNLPGSGFPIFIHTMGMSSGATTVLPGLFSPAAAVEAALAHGVTIMFCVPTMLNAIEQHCSQAGIRIPTLRLIIQLGSPIVPAITERARQTFRCEFQNWYGSTEANGAICIMRESDFTGDPEADRLLATSVGLPLPHVDVEIHGDDDRPVGAGTIGEICVRGPVLQSYLNRPEETAEAWRGAWFHMGDIGYQDASGHIFLSDRKHFMIVSGGYNVYPAVVENVLAQHPAVAEVAVVGAPHPKWGEAVVAVVVRARDTADVTSEQLIAHCSASVGKWEVPKHVEFVEALPLGTTGKIQKREIRNWFLSDRLRCPWNA